MKTELTDHAKGLLSVASCYLCWVETSGSSIEDIVNNESVPEDVREMVKCVADAVGKFDEVLPKEDVARLSLKALCKMLDDAL